MTAAKKTPTERGAVSDPAGPSTVGTAPPADARVMGKREPDASPQVSPSRTRHGKDGGPGASDAPTGLPVADWPPGVYGGIPDLDYHAHPALSSSGARALLPPSCPAKFRWEQLHGRPDKRTFDFGHAAHARVLGVGAEIVVVQTTAKDGAKADAVDYRTKSAGDHRDEIRATGAVPILAAELAVVDAMAEAIRAHPVASVLFDPDRGGHSEQSAFWHDDRYDVDRRARFDWLPALRPDGRLIVPDYKTTTSAERGAFTKSVSSYGYHVQDVWYRDAVLDLGLADEVAFVFVAQEKTPPFLINVFELDDDWLRVGRVDVDRALGVFADCVATDSWPSYSSEVELITPPAWLARLYEGVPA